MKARECGEEGWASARPETALAASITVSTSSLPCTNNAVAATSPLWRDRRDVNDEDGQPYLITASIPPKLCLVEMRGLNTGKSIYSSVPEGRSDVEGALDSVTSSGMESETNQLRGLYFRAISFLSSEQVVVHLLIGVAVCVGCLMRIAMSGFHVFATESNQSFQVFNVVGCMIMGFIVEHKRFIHDSRGAGSRGRQLYVALTSGLCGSITSFSTMQMECSKSFFLQWDMTWGGYSASYNGGRFFEFIICQFSGFATPIIALHVGYFLGSTFSPLSNHNLSADEATIKQLSNKAASNPIDFFALLPFFAFALTVFLVLVVPLAGVHPSRGQVSAACCLGVLGAFGRFHLAKYNQRSKAFPIGTFMANTTGTWLAALVALLSKFMTDSVDHGAQGALYGIAMGLCGCLTTMSTFVKEIDDLSRRNAYRYALISIALSQIGIMTIFGAFAFSTVKVSSVAPEPVDICAIQSTLCGTLLHKIGCPSERIAVVAAYSSQCASGSSYNSAFFNDDACTCGSLSLSRTTELVVESQARGQVASALVPLWPHNYREIRDPTETVQLCLSHAALCSAYMDRIGCPLDARRTDHLCGTPFRGPWSCACGSHAAANAVVTNLILDQLLNSRYDMRAYQGHMTQASLNVDAAYYHTCKHALQHAGCFLREHSRILGTEVEGDYSTWRGECSCGERAGVDAIAAATDHLGRRVPRLLMAAALRPVISSLFVVANASMGTYDICTSYTSMCEYFLDYMQCPADLRSVGGCSNVSDVSSLVPRCRCGSLDSLDSAPISLMTDALLSECMWTGQGCVSLSEGPDSEDVVASNRRWYYLRETRAPYGMAIGSNPLKQLDFFV